MESKFIDQVMPAGYSLPEFNILKDDANLSNVFIIQPKGTIIGDNDGVRATNVNHDDKLNDYLQKSISNGADLVVSPEYCFSGSNLFGKISSAELTPTENSLWVLGLQSISLLQLRELRTTYLNIKWIYEDLIDADENKFVSPLAYIFRARNNTTDELEVFIIIQFKTHHMVDTVLQLERMKLIHGKIVYVFRNARDEIRLGSIICADAAQFIPRDIFPDWDRYGYIVLHPQLNLDPIHYAFRSYRDEWAKYPVDKKHIYCINWARGTTINGHNGNNHLGYSCFYTKDLTHPTIESHLSNHDKGLYYSFDSEYRVHCFYLNFDEYYFKIIVAKVSRLNVIAAHANFPCPKIDNVYSWQNAPAGWITANHINADYDQVCFWKSAAYQNILKPANTVEKEIILLRLSGYLEGGLNELTNLESFKLISGEKIKRLTFIQNKNVLADCFRDSIKNNFVTLCNMILSNLEEYPLPLKEYFNNYKISYSNRTLNLMLGTEEKASAFVAYIGLKDESEALKIFEKVSDSVDTENIFRISIWYLDPLANTFGKKFNMNKDISNPQTESLRSVTREKSYE